jgi:FKBP-type peptidyl-prolyl cis-trans isomerase SlyD
MKNNEGEVLENTMDNPPVEYLHGSGKILPSLEAGLEGLERGDQRTLTFLPEANSGITQALNFDVIVDDVRAATEEEIQFGKPLKANEKNNCGPTCCC